MNEMEKCPFCGGEFVVRESPWLDGTPAYTFWHADEKLAAEMKCPLTMACYGTEAELIEAVNTRHVETCEWRFEHSGTMYDKWRCSKCGYLFVEPRCDQGYNDMDPNFCPSCGRKVVDA